LTGRCNRSALAVTSGISRRRSSAVNQSRRRRGKCSGRTRDMDLVRLQPHRAARVGPVRMRCGMPKTGTSALSWNGRGDGRRLSARRDPAGLGAGGEAFRA
jgi:hypothetical protein